jgi:transcriptional regulator with XRE-family HTH domain
MSNDSASDPDKVIETGLLLKEARTSKGLSLDQTSKLLGMSRDHVNAIEDGNTAFFKKSTQSLIWHARLYAKKFGVVLPELAFNNITRATGTSSNPVQKIPAFLLKSISQTEPTKTSDGRN